jgi:hypothetical protein
VTGLKKQKIILGFPWLQKYNPTIDWKRGTLTWKTWKVDWKRLLEKGRTNRRKSQQPRIEEIKDEEELLTHTVNPIKEEKEEILIDLLKMDLWIHRTNVATELAMKENSKKAELTDEQLVPEEYHEYLDIFNETKAARFPKSQSWDHKIEMKEGFEPKSFKNYNLTPAEQIEH